MESISWPSIKAVANDLRVERDGLRSMFRPNDPDLADEDGNSGTDCRLQVSEEGWSVHTGLADYDQDHRGYWGASWLPYGRANLYELARDLIDQARDAAAY